MILDAATHTLELVTSLPLQVDCVISYADLTTTTFTGAAQNTSISTATTTTVLAAPGASTVRQVKDMTVRNRDGSQTVTVRLQKNANGSVFYVSPDVALPAGYELQWYPQTGFSVVNPFGEVKVLTDTALIDADGEAIDISSLLKGILAASKETNELLFSVLNLFNKESLNG
jgi:hypothetical protein